MPRREQRNRAPRPDDPPPLWRFLVLCRNTAEPSPAVVRAFDCTAEQATDREREIEDAFASACPPGTHWSHATEVLTTFITGPGPESERLRATLDWANTQDRHVMTVSCSPKEFESMADATETYCRQTASEANAQQAGDDIVKDEDNEAKVKEEPGEERMFDATHFEEDGSEVMDRQGSQAQIKKEEMADY